MKPKIDNKYPIDENIAKRWSGRSYSDKPVEKDVLMSLFEAARWAASAFNEQPWQYVVGVKGDTNYDKIFDVLVEFNQSWAKSAPVLILVTAKKQFAKNGNENIHSWYDTGQSMANLSIQATKFNLNVHQMGGFDQSKAETQIILDDNYEAVCVAAIGYRAEPESLPEGLREDEKAQQTRKSIDEVVLFS